MMTRCECWQLSFIGLLSYARRRGITTLDELMKATGAGTRCGTCRPYLEELLRTGRLRCGDQLIELPGVNAPGVDVPGMNASGANTPGMDASGGGTSGSNRADG